MHRCSESRAADDRPLHAEVIEERDHVLGVLRPRVSRGIGTDGTTVSANVRKRDGTDIGEPPCQRHEHAMVWSAAMKQDDDRIFVTGDRSMQRPSVVAMVRERTEFGGHRRISYSAESRDRRCFAFGI